MSVERVEDKREDMASDDRYRLYVPQRTQTIQRARCTSPAHEGYWRLRPAVVALAITTTTLMLQLGLAMGLNV